MIRGRTLLAGLGLSLLALAVLAGGLWAALTPQRAAVPTNRDWLLLADVTLVEPGRARRPHTNVLVRDGRIERLGPGEPSEAIPRAGMAGLYLLPGLIDLHVHLPPRFVPGGPELFGLLFLAHGVTTVRDVGSFRGDALAVGRAIAEGRYPGPRVFTCGPPLDGEKPVWPGSSSVKTADQARRAIERRVGQGAACAKLYEGLAPDVVRALIEAARENGLPVVGHVPRSVSLRALPGVEVQHLMGAGPNWLQLSEQDMDRYVRASRALEISHTPTLVVFRRLALASEAGEAAYPEAARFLPRFYREELWSAARNARLAHFLQGEGRHPAARLRAMERLVAALHAGAVPVYVGTDTPNLGVVPGAAVHEELALLAEAGLTLEASWLAATRAAGPALGEPLLGRLEPGAPADLLLFREDPTRNLAALATLQAVLAAGRLYRREALDEALERYRHHMTGALYERATGLAARFLLRMSAHSAP